MGRTILGQATLWVYHASPLVAGALLGAFWQVLVIFGLHWGIIPIGFNNLAVHGIDPILALIFAASFAQIGAVLGVWMKTKDKKLKHLVFQLLFQVFSALQSRRFMVLHFRLKAVYYELYCRRNWRRNTWCIWYTRVYDRRTWYICDSNIY